MASNPMQQFSVHKIGPEIKIAGVDLSFTNASLFMIISTFAILIFLFLGTKERKIVPDNFFLVPGVGAQGGVFRRCSTLWLE